MRNPPSYLQGHVREPRDHQAADLLSDGVWCGHGEPDFVIYEVHENGDSALSVRLPMKKPYPALCAVSAFRPGNKPFFVYDPRHHPASVFSFQQEHSYSPNAPHECPSCKSVLFRIAIGFEIPGDSEEAEDTSWFALAVQCVACGVAEILFDDETA
jgi:hypothetical protein